LRTYQSELVPRLADLGATLVAISPQSPDESLSAAEKSALQFPVLSDAGCRVARRLGIVVDESQEALDAQRSQFTPGQNFLRWALLDPVARELYVDWEEAIDNAVSGLREVAGTDPDDPRLHRLVAEFSAASLLFRELWARAGVGYRLAILHMRHPRVGELYLDLNQLNVPYAPNAVGQHVLICHAKPGSDSERALEELRSLSAAPPDASTTRPKPALS
jgi:MmyB-like transcription regulator ligand binding domain/AhpC/TSA family